MNTQNTEHKFGTYKYHMERAKFWAEQAERRTSKAVANADMKMSAHHLNLAHECIDK